MITTKRIIVNKEIDLLKENFKIEKERKWKESEKFRKLYYAQPINI